jgi:hypothetical protein
VTSCPLIRQPAYSQPKNVLVRSGACNSAVFRQTGTRQ